ncbi:MAG: hypothetical protein LBS21_12630 [Clostridiales bacterium]|jgi:hypothetical protein|nr:hypothetical protein [Clostridiales bacterium]
MKRKLLIIPVLIGVLAVCSCQPKTEAEKTADIMRDISPEFAGMDEVLNQVENMQAAPTEPEAPESGVMTFKEAVAALYDTADKQYTEAEKEEIRADMDEIIAAYVATYDPKALFAQTAEHNRETVDEGFKIVNDPEAFPSDLDRVITAMFSAGTIETSELGRLLLKHPNINGEIINSIPYVSFNLNYELLYLTSLDSRLTSQTLYDMLKGAISKKCPEWLRNALTVNVLNGNPEELAIMYDEILRITEADITYEPFYNENIYIPDYAAENFADENFLLRMLDSTEKLYVGGHNPDGVWSDYVQDEKKAIDYGRAIVANPHATKAVWEKAAQSSSPEIAAAANKKLNG